MCREGKRKNKKYEKCDKEFSLKNLFVMILKYLVIVYKFRSFSFFRDLLSGHILLLICYGEIFV